MDWRDLSEAEVRYRACIEVASVKSLHIYSACQCCVRFQLLSRQQGALQRGLENSYILASQQHTFNDPSSLLAGGAHGARAHSNATTLSRWLAQRPPLSDSGNQWHVILFRAPLALLAPSAVVRVVSRKQ